MVENKNKNQKINEYVIEVAKESIEKLRNIESESPKNLFILKKSKVINETLLSMIKQQDIDLRKEDLQIREKILEARKDRTDCLKENNDIQKKKIER